MFLNRLYINIQLNSGIKTKVWAKISVSNYGGFFMGNNMLTTKEATLISDLLTLEETACKKARLYARILTDREVAEKFNEIANNHERRFNALFEML